MLNTRPAPSPPPATHDAPVVVIGGGPVGVRAAQRLAAQGHRVTVLSAEPYEPYNRVRLTPLLSGEAQFGEIALPDLKEAGDGVTLYEGQRVVKIDRAERHVITADGAVWPYTTLVMATGSRAAVPGNPGTDLPGVYTFRTAEDASALVARSFSARRVVVIGGGLLGLEAAKGMRRRQCSVTVIEHESRLMPRQLDDAAGARLADNIRELDVEVLTDTAVKQISGIDRVTGIELSDKRTLACDTVIICTGVRANIDLARDSRLSIGRGIVVNDQMQTSDPAIYAVGECCEHKGRMYGLVGPGYAQAEVAALSISGQHQDFDGSVPASKLKVIGADVFSVGEVEQLEVRANVRSHVWQDDQGYRRIFVERGKLVGALGVGPWPQSSLVQDAVQQGLQIYPWMLFRFRANGLLWSERDDDPTAMPDSATLCNCTGVSCGQVRGAMAGGAASVEAVGLQTGAGTVCGTCRPLLAEMIDAGAKPEPMPLWKPVLALSGVAALAALYPLVAGNVPLPSSFDADSLRTWLWRDNIVKQYSCFVLLGLTLAAMVIGLRKRFRFMDRLGSFDGWRLAHIVIGLIAGAGFVAHTGFRLGDNLNLWLGASFIATVGVGAIAGLATGGDHELRARRIGSARKPPRKLPIWVHILAVWPLPVLILAHVLASYAF